MNKIKVSIIVLVVILIIVLVAAAAIIFSIIRYDEENYGEDYVEQPLNTNIQEVTSSTYFFIVEDTVQTYCKYIYSEYEGTNLDTIVDGISSEAYKRNALISVLDKSYITENNITNENVFDYVDDLSGYTTFQADRMKFLEGRNVNTYIVEGRLFNNMQLIGTRIYMINLDNTNMSFSIKPMEGNFEDIIEIIRDDSQIESNSYNRFEYVVTSEETLITKYFSRYKTEIIGNIENAYSLLDAEYRDLRFDSIDEFSEYISNKQIQYAYISQYQKNEYDGYTQYICLDQNNNYYIINATGLMEYTVMLDTYTVDLPQFIEEYNNANDAEKAGMNLEKVFTAVNNGDYEYVYNKLDSTFKQNNFPTLESFETYMSETFYDNNTVEYSNYQNNAGLHMYDVSVTNTDDANSSAVTKTFIMQLLDGTDFVMSFNV